MRKVALEQSRLPVRDKRSRGGLEEARPRKSQRERRKAGSCRDVLYSVDLIVKGASFTRSVSRSGGTTINTRMLGHTHFIWFMEGNSDFIVVSLVLL